LATLVLDASEGTWVEALARDDCVAAMSELALARRVTGMVRLSIHNAVSMLKNSI